MRGWLSAADDETSKTHGAKGDAARANRTEAERVLTPLGIVAEDYLIDREL